MRIRLVVLLLGLLCSGCGKAGISDARMNHLLAADHGWLDLTVTGAAITPQVAGECALVLSVNGEEVLRERADFSAAVARGVPVGYRFPVPAGQLELGLDLACGNHRRVFQQSLPLAKDELQLLSLQAGVLQVGPRSAWRPASLDEVRGRLDEVVGELSHARRRLAFQERLLWLCLLFNLLLAALFLMQWWRRWRG